MGEKGSEKEEGIVSFLLAKGGVVSCVFWQQQQIISNIARALTFAFKADN